MRKNIVFAFAATAALVAGLALVWVAVPGLLPRLPAGDGTQPTLRAHWADDYRNLREMVGGVDVVVVATNVLSQPGRVEDADTGNPLPFTNQFFRSEQVLKGQVGGNFVVEQTGGSVGGAVLSIDDGGPYSPGSRYLLFLNKQPDTDMYYLVNPQGRFLNEGGQMRAAQRGAASNTLHGRTEADAIALVGRGGR